MKFIDTLTNSTKNYVQNRLKANASYAHKMEKAKDYNTKMKLEQEIKAGDELQAEVAQCKSLYEDTKLASRIKKDEFLASKFTMALTQEDVATLDNLEKIKVSDNEMRLFFEKYKYNPLALRRLESIANEHNHTDVVMEQVSMSFRKYDEYNAKYKDFEHFCDTKLVEVDNFEPLDPIDKFKQIILEVIYNGLDQQEEALNSIFSALEA